MSTAPAGRLACITGASSGIGQALAERYLRAGWRVVLVARREDALRDWRQRQGEAAARVSLQVADVSDTAAITAAGRDCIARHGLPDVVIANAGFSIGVDSAQFDDLEVLRRLYATNVIGMAATFQPFVGPMRERGSGRLVGVASVAGIRGLPGHGGYCGSKAAVISYLESLRVECRASGVRVVTLVPGYVDTPLTQANRYPMPFLMQAPDFADRAFAAIARGASYRVIPWPMGVVAQLLRLLPNAVYDRVMAKAPRKHREEASG